MQDESQAAESRAALRARSWKEGTFILIVVFLYATFHDGWPTWASLLSSIRFSATFCLLLFLIGKLWEKRHEARLRARPQLAPTWNYLRKIVAQIKAGMIERHKRTKPLPLP